MKLLQIAEPEQALSDQRSDGAIRSGSIPRSLLQSGPGFKAGWASKRAGLQSGLGLNAAGRDIG
jgi:hypothetical protein